MQLVIPKRKDIRRYAVFSERAFQGNDAQSLLWYMRNARTHVESIVSDTQVKLAPVMGGSGSQLKLTRISHLGVLPDFKTDEAIFRTLVPIPTGYNVNGRCNGSNEGKTVKDGPSPFAMSTANVPLMADGLLACFIPTQVGQYSIPNGNYVLPQLFSNVRRGGSTSYGGVMTQNLALLRSTTDVLYTPTVATHDSDSTPATRPLYSNINSDAGSVMLMWGGNLKINPESRFDLPVKSDQTQPEVPGVNLSISEPSVNITGCFIPMMWGNEIRIYKPQQMVDFTAYNQAVGATPTMSMAKIELPFDEIINV